MFPGIRKELAVIPDGVTKNIGIRMINTMTREIDTGIFWDGMS